MLNLYLGRSAAESEGWDVRQNTFETLGDLELNFLCI